MVGNENSGRRKEPKGDKVSHADKVSPYKPISYSGKYFSSMITSKPTAPAAQKDPLDESMKTVQQDINEKIQSWATIKKAESVGMPKEIVDEMKEQLNLNKKPQTEENATMDQKDMMLMQMIQQEEDPQMKQIYLMSLMGKGSKGIDPTMMALVMNNGSKKKDSDSFMEKLALKFLEDKTDNKNEIQKGMEFFKQMMEMRDMVTPKDPIEDILKNKEKFIELGLLQEPSGGSIEDKKLDLEFRKLDYEHERAKAESEAKTDSQADIMKTISEGVTALLGSIGHFTSSNKKQTGIDQQVATENQIQNSNGNKIMGVCSNPECNTRFPVVTDKDRSVNCPNGECNFTYVIKDKQFYLSEESEKLLNEAPSSNEQDVKLE